VGYALVLVTGTEQRVFASESGRFVLSGLASGRLTIRIQQIGYGAVTLPLQIDAGGPAGPGGPGIEVALTRPRAHAP
jgi:hypothetical protein